jgi:hypothetical protein
LLSEGELKRAAENAKALTDVEIARRLFQSPSRVDQNLSILGESGDHISQANFTFLCLLTLLP